MAIKFIKGNIFEQPVQAIVNPVNCVGVMGKGLALQFKNRTIQGYFSAYQKDCRSGHLKPGTITWWQRQTGCNLNESVEFLCNFPTKIHWRDPSQLIWIEQGLKALAHALQNSVIKSIAIPRLGSGLGGLDWNDVKPLIVKHLTPASKDIDVYVLE